MDRFLSKLLLSLIAIMASASLLSSCGDDSDDKDKMREPYGTWTETTRNTYMGHIPGISSSAFYSGVIGEKEINGNSYQRVKISFDIASPSLVSENTQGTEFWITRKNDNTYLFAGFEEISILSATIDPPLTLNLNPPVGETQTMTANAMLKLDESETPTAVSGTATYTLVSDNETVVTVMGSISGCRHFQGSANVTGDGIPAAFGNVDVTFDIYTHKDYGIVKWNFPLFSSGLDLQGTQDLGVTEDGYRLVQKMGVAGGYSGTFDFNTRDATGIEDADKNTHAKMLLEIRYANPEKAVTDTMPPANTVFHTSTLYGFFEHQFIPSKISLFHPEEAGQNFHYWIAFVDKAAKNETDPDGISYGITVAPTTSDAVLCTARILYKVYGM